MLQFLTYLLHKQIIEMRCSQNLRCPFSVPSWRLQADLTEVYGAMYIFYPLFILKSSLYYRPLEILHFLSLKYAIYTPERLLIKSGL